jgi:hypothetical protein
VVVDYLQRRKIVTLMPPADNGFDEVDVGAGARLVNQSAGERLDLCVC